jgi:hypothetical protein
MTFESEYSGALTKTGGTFSGTQSWRDGRNNSGKRACTAALVFAPQVIKLARNDEYKAGKR